MPSGIRIWNIEKEEQRSVAILLIQSVFLGLFAGAFDVGAHSIFLNVFEASLIPQAYVVTGIVGIIMTSVYVRLQNRMKFSEFALLNLIFVVVVTLLLRLGFVFTQDKLLVFASFVLMGPLTITSFLVFWGTAGRIFNLRQGKRLFGLIDTGQVIGIIVSSFAIPVLISFNFKVLNSLIICVVSIFIALIIQTVLMRNYNLDIKTEAIAGKTEKSTITSIFRNDYTRLLAFFVVLSVLTAFFVHFSFLSVLKENYPDPDIRASFFGAFMGALTIFTVIIKTFVFDKLIKTYGLKITLMLSPVLLGLFTIIASLIGSIFGYTVISMGFPFFFLLIALSKLFARSLKDSIEVPSLKILYQLLDPKIRYDVQARIDGTVNELAAFSSGLLLLGLGLISSVKLIHFSYFLIIILVLWAFAAIRLYKSYKESLGISLKKFQETAIDDSSSGSHLERLIPGGDDHKVGSVLQLAPQTWNGLLLKNLKGLLNSGKQLKSFTLSLIDRLYLFESDKELSEFESLSIGEEREHIRRIRDEFNISDEDEEEVRLRDLLNSDHPEDRKKALLAILRKRDTRFYPRVVTMFRDPDHSVRISAIRTAGLLGRKDFVTYLIDLLEDPQYYSYAFNALRGMGDAIMENLEHGFYKTHITDKGMIRITRIMAEIGTPLSSSYLINKLDHFNINVLKEAVNGLIKNRIELTDADKMKVFDALYRVVGIAAWNLASYQSAKQYQLDPVLVGAFEEELSENYDLIFGLLSVAYDPQSIYHIRKNIESGTTESIGFAIELLDLFIDPGIKTYLFPLLDDTGIYEKINRLQSEFPIEINEPVKLLTSIINRDCNQIMTYTKFCALRIIGKMENCQISPDIIAQMFNPEPVLREMASDLVRNLDLNKHRSILERLEDKSADEIRNHLKNKENGEDRGEIMKFELLKASGIFKDLKNHYLLGLSKRFEIMKFNLPSEVNILGSVIKDSVFFVVEGDLQIRIPQGRIMIEKNKLFMLPGSVSECEVISEMNEKLILLIKVNKLLLQELIFDDENAYLSVAELIQNMNEFLTAPVIK